MPHLPFNVTQGGGVVVLSAEQDSELTLEVPTALLAIPGLLDITVSSSERPGFSTIKFKTKEPIQVKFATPAGWTFGENHDQNQVEASYEYDVPPLGFPKLSAMIWYNPFRGGTGIKLFHTAGKD